MADLLNPANADTDPPERSVEEVLHTVGDANCRAILRSVSETPMTASEIAEKHDLSLSSSYRKLGDLTDIGLLSERPRISVNGGHASEYCREADRLTLDFDGRQVRYGTDPSERDVWESVSPADLRTAIAERDGGNEVLRLVVAMLYLRGLDPEEIATWLWLPAEQVVTWLDDPPEPR
jgi:DNA-binding transcriptional ArsR family regulator